MTSDLKRYDRPGAPPTGEFVKYSDYAELSRQHDELLAALKQAVWHIVNFHYGKAEHLLRQAIAKAGAE